MLVQMCVRGCDCIHCGGDSVCGGGDGGTLSPPSLCSSCPSGAEVRTPISHPGGGCARFWVREVGLLIEGGEKGGWWVGGVRYRNGVKCEVCKRSVS